MRRAAIVLWILALASLRCLAQDATRTDGDKYKVVLENDCVRVLDYHDKPGDITHQHHHSAFVLYALSPFQRTIHLPNGKLIHRDFKAGDALWSEAQTHTGENTGTTPSHALLVESKPGAGKNAKCSGP